MSTQSINIKGTPKQIFAQIKPEKIREWCPDFCIADENENVDYKTEKNTGAQYVMRIKKRKPYKSISGTIEPISSDISERLSFEWRFKSAKLENGKDWTEINMEFKMPNKSQRKEWWLGVAIPAVITSSELGFANMPLAHANTFSQIGTNSAIVEMLIVKKKVLLSIALLTIGSGAPLAILADDQGPEIYLNYAIVNNPPGDYSGTTILIKSFTAEDINGISDSGCDIYDRHHVGVGNFTFTCQATDDSLSKNNSTKEITVIVNEPDKSHWPDCVERYLLTPAEYINDDEVLNIHAYQSHQFDSIVEKYENESERLVASGEHNKARIVSSILLDRINPHSIPGLSNFANAIRDENRVEHGIDYDKLNCAIEIHSEALIQNKAWGPLALAEDLFLKGEYDEAIELTNKGIDGYDDPTNYYDLNNYVNALIIRGNSFLNMGELEKAEIDYNRAIKFNDKKFDAWLGLGLVEYRKGNVELAMPHLEKAHSLDHTNKDVSESLIRVWLPTNQHDKIINLFNSIEDSKLKDYLQEKFPDFAHL